MSNASKREYLESIRLRYHHGSKKVKQLVLNEFCEVCGYNRTYAIRLLNARPDPYAGQGKTRAGRRTKYHQRELKDALVVLWKAGNLPCGKRLKAMIPSWLPHYPKLLSDEVKTLLMTIAPATIDRLLRPLRTRYSKRGLSTTKPGSLLKQHIPIKTNQWDEQMPGFLEADTVAHCGSSTAGMYASTVNMVDIATTWTEQRAIWGKGELVSSIPPPAFNMLSRLPSKDLIATMARSFSTGRCSNTSPSANTPFSTHAHASTTKMITPTLKAKTGLRPTILGL